MAPGFVRGGIKAASDFMEDLKSKEWLEMERQKALKKEQKHMRKLKKKGKNVESEKVKINTEPKPVSPLIQVKKQISKLINRKKD